MCRKRKFYMNFSYNKCGGNPPNTANMIAKEDF